MLLSSNFIVRGANVISRKLSKKKEKKKEKYSAHKTLKKTVEETDGIIIAVLALLLILMEIFLIVYLLQKTLTEVPPGGERTTRIILIILVPELYALFYMFLRHKKTSALGYEK